MAKDTRPCHGTSMYMVTTPLTRGACQEDILVVLTSLQRAACLGALQQHTLSAPARCSQQHIANHFR